MNQQRMTVHDAARRLGISEDAVRMRVKRGKLPADKEGGRLYVRLDTEPTTEPTDRSFADELITELRDRVRSLERVLEEERQARTEERRRHDTLMAQLVQRIPELEPPTSPEARESPERATGEPESSQPRPATPGPHEPISQPSWWRRMFGS